MIDVKGVAHFSIPVTDMDRSQKFYTEVVGLQPLALVANGTMSFLDAGGVCVILCEQETPIDQSAQGPNRVHHSFVVDTETYKTLHDHLESNGVSVEFEEDRQGGSVNGPRLYFRDPDGTSLEFIDLTSYAGAQH